MSDVAILVCLLGILILAVLRPGSIVTIAEAVLAAAIYTHFFGK